MKSLKIIATVLAILVLLSSCSGKSHDATGSTSDADSKEFQDTTDKADIADTTAKETETEPPVTEPLETWGSPMTLPEPAVEDLISDDRYFIKLDQYLDILSGYIHEEYSAGQELDFANLHKMIIRCCVANRRLSNASFNETYCYVTISKK